MSERIEIVRAVALDDIAIQRGGDGRTVVAYASVFAPYEVVDPVDGLIEERNHPEMFNRSLRRGALSRFQCLFNHGRTIDGAESERYSMPLGVPLEITPDTVGLRTVTRYSKTPLADEVLELIRDGAITGMSWSGVAHESRRLGRSARTGLPVVERVVASLREYGPTPFPAASEAKILTVRSVSTLAAEVEALSEEDREQLLTQISAPPGDPGASPVEQDPADGTTDPQPQPAGQAPADGPSIEIDLLTQQQRRRRADAERKQ